MSDEKQERTPEEIAAKIEVSKAAARRLGAEAAIAELEAREQALEVEKAELAMHKVREDEERRLAGDNFHRQYPFSGQVTGSTVDTCITKLKEWHRIDPKCPITIIFNSPGGEVVAGMNLFDFICYLRREGHFVTTVCMGYAASMAGILLQAGDKRIMGAESYLLIHEVSFSAAGSMGDVEDTVEWVKKIQNRVLDIFSKRSTMKRATIKRKWTRKDWWLSSAEALAAGFVDEVGA